MRYDRKSTILIKRTSRRGSYLSGKKNGQYKCTGQMLTVS